MISIRKYHYYFRTSNHDLQLLVIGLLNPLSVNFTKWSNTLKQFVCNMPTNCLSVFGHFVGLALNRLNSDTRHSVYQLFAMASCSVNTNNSNVVFIRKVHHRLKCKFVLILSRSVVAFNYDVFIFNVPSFKNLL